MNRMENTMKAYLKGVAKAILNKKIKYTNKKEYVIHNNKRFEDKVVLVTGGSGAIGGAIAYHLAMEGAKVYLGGRNIEKLETRAEEWQSKGFLAYPLVMNVTDERSIQNAAEHLINNEGRIDILVNCAGGSTRNKNTNLVDQSVEMIDEMLNSNLRGSMLCTRIFGKHMELVGKGKIINIASVIGEHGKPRFSDYAASKAGIIGYTKSVAQELGPKGVNVNCVSPGLIQRGEFSEDQLPYLLHSNFLNKVGCAEDVACAVAFLASDEAGFITGQNLCVDGGRSLGLHGD